MTDNRFFLRYSAFVFIKSTIVSCKVAKCYKYVAILCDPDHVFSKCREFRLTPVGKAAFNGSFVASLTFLPGVKISR